MNKTKVEKALKLLRDALRNKYGEGTEAKIIITEDGISLDDKDGAVALDSVLQDAVAQELTS